MASRNSSRGTRHFGRRGGNRPRFCPPIRPYFAVWVWPESCRDHMVALLREAESICRYAEARGALTLIGRVRKMLGGAA